MTVHAGAAARVRARPRRRLGPAALGVLGVLPALLLIAALIAYPVGYSIWLSLLDKHSFFPAERWVGLDNYVYLLRDTEFWDSLWKGVVYATGTTALQLVAGVVAALVLHQPFVGRNAFAHKGGLHVAGVRADATT